MTQRTNTDPRRGRRLRHGLLLTGLLVALGSTALALAYPGLTEDLWAELRYAEADELWDDLAFYHYNFTWFEQLRPEATSGRFDLPDLPAGSVSDPLDRAQHHYHRGDFSQAIADLEAAIADDGASEPRLLWLGLAYQRQAELDGCQHHLATTHGAPAEQPQPWGPTSVCALPVAPVASAAPSFEKAAATFERLLDDFAPEDPVYCWLLTFSVMAQGRYPEGVPERYRLDSPLIERFYGAEAQRTLERFDHLVFHDRARDLGVDVLDAGKGVAVEDFDGDGFLDLVTGGSFETLRLFHNDGGKRFLDVTDRRGLDGLLQPFIVTTADVDNDGWMDLFVGRPYHAFALMRNRGDGTFEDITQRSGLLDGLEPGQSVFTFVSAWADIDLDGDLDLFLAQLGRRLPLGRGLLAREPMPSTLFVNEGGRFVDATRAWGLGPVVADRTFTGATFGDVDDDGDADLFLSSFTRGLSVLLRNTGGRFEPTSEIHNPDAGFMASFLDVDHDGRLDLFQGANGPARGMVQQAVLGSEPRTTNRLFLQRGSTPGRRFVDRSDLLGPLHIGSMGVSYGDLDNDGCHDFYLGTGNSEPTFVLPNLMLVGVLDGTRCTGAHEDVSRLAGFGSVQKGHGIVFFDFDNDGDQDVYSSLGGMWPADPWPNQLFVNESTLDRRWLKLRLRGRTSNRFGVGARLRVVARNGAGEAIVRTAQIGGKTGFGSAPHLAYIGLLDAVTIDRVEVRWPGTTVARQYTAHLDTLQTLDEHDGVPMHSTLAQMPPRR